ncbi:MAG: hypothetical protein AAGU11_09665 [Syntrophobacteraceae bacterium]
MRKLRFLLIFGFLAIFALSAQAFADEPDKTVGGAVTGGAAGAVVGGPVGAGVGAVMGGAAGSAADREEESMDRDMGNLESDRDLSSPDSRATVPPERFQDSTLDKSRIDNQ